MRGTLARVGSDDGPPADASDDAPGALTVTVTTHDLERFLPDPRHPATLIGTLDAPVLSDAPLMVSEGELDLQVRLERVD